jgi:hypothetical protein
MAIRLLATYEMVDREDKHLGTVRLPVVGFSEPDEDGREWPRVLLFSGDEPYIVDFHPESSLETPYGTLQGFVVDAVSDPIAAPPGWVAELWVGRIGPEQPQRLGTYPVLAWEPEPQTSWDDYPQGHAVLLCPSVMTRSAAIRVRSARVISPVRRAIAAKMTHRSNPADRLNLGVSSLQSSAAAHGRVRQPGRLPARSVPEPLNVLRQTCLTALRAAPHTVALSGAVSTLHTWDGGDGSAKRHRVEASAPHGSRRIGVGWRESRSTPRPGAPSVRVSDRRR